MKHSFALFILTLLSNTLNALMIDNINNSNMMNLSENENSQTITIFPAKGSFGTEGQVSFGFDAFNEGISTVGISMITWSNAVGIDIMKTGIDQVFTFNTLGVSPNLVDIILSVTDGMNNTDSVAITSVTDGLQHIAFSAYSGVDFTNVTNVSLVVKSINPATNFALNISQVSIPEPASLLLLGIGLIFFRFSYFRSIIQAAFFSKVHWLFS